MTINNRLLRLEKLLQPGVKAEIIKPMTDDERKQAIATLFLVDNPNDVELRERREIVATIFNSSIAQLTKMCLEWRVENES